MGHMHDYTLQFLILASIVVIALAGILLPIGLRSLGRIRDRLGGADYADWIKFFLLVFMLSGGLVTAKMCRYQMMISSSNYVVRLDRWTGQIISLNIRNISD